MLVVELAYFFGRSPASFGRSYLLNDLSTAMPLILVATGQAIVIISGGIDISVGGTISLVSALAAKTFTASDTDVIGWSIALVLVGLGIGAINGFLIGQLGLSPVIVTIATWSITGGLADRRPAAPGGNISGGGRRRMDRVTLVHPVAGAYPHSPFRVLVRRCAAARSERSSTPLAATPKRPP